MKRSVAWWQSALSVGWSGRAESSHKPGPQRQAAIDLLRGVAALIVATDHFLTRLGRFAFPRAHLVVELFFVMSGFVLTSRTLAQRRNTLPTVRFMVHRLARLYPVYAIGIAAGTLEYCVARTGGFSGWITPIGAGDIAANFVLLPAFWSPGRLFPINGPMWTLPIEIGLNGVLFPLIRMRRVYLVLLILLSIAAMTVAACRAGTLNLGWSWGTMLGGWARGAFAFLTGILLARVVRPRVLSGWWIVVVLIGFALMTVAPMPTPWELPVELAGAIVAIPALFLLASSVRLPDRLAPGARMLAGMSFPIYCLHTALIRPVIDLGGLMRMTEVAMTTVYLILCIGVALAAAKIPTPTRELRRSRLLVVR